MKLIIVCPEIFQAGSCSSGKSEDGDVRLILSGAISQAQPALSFKKSYERDWEAGEQTFQGKTKIQTWDKKGGRRGYQGFSGEHTGKSRHYPLPAAAVSRQQVVSTHAVVASNRGKKIHLSSSNLWEHHFCPLNGPATQPTSSACLCAKVQACKTR